MTAPREQLIDELRQWIAAAIDELKRNLDALRSGADPTAIMPRLAASLSWSPIIDDVVRLIEEPPIHGPARNDHAKRILVVDDSDGYRLLATRVLSVAGYEVDPAESGSAAWERLGQQSFDVMVTDAEMPEMDGLELIRRVRASRDLAHLPVILLTGRDGPDDERAGLAAGADAFLCKFRPDTVRDLLSHLARLTQRGPRRSL
jgi:CheY-like chemotaxis protein